MTKVEKTIFEIGDIFADVIRGDIKSYEMDNGKVCIWVDLPQVGDWYEQFFEQIKRFVSVEQIIFNPYLFLIIIEK